MTRFLAKRLATFAATLIGASILIFLMLEILPGNPAQVLLGPEAPPATVEAMAHKLGVDRPPVERYLDWVGGMLRGDFGTSYAYGTPVGGLVRDRLAVSLPLALMAMVLTTFIGLMLGVGAAARRGGWLDLGLMGLSQLGIAIPSFWLAILLILLFAVDLHWFSAGGFPGWHAGFWPALRALTLPAISLAAVQGAILARITRSAVLEVAREDFVRTAHAKGLTAQQALWRHVLRNALIPIATIMGLQFTSLIAGTIVIESVFYLPGLGQLAFQSISNRDIAVVRDVVMLLAALVVLVNLIVDLLYVIIDPRLEAHDL